MLAIARALMARPKLLLLDEPSLGLAPRIVQDVMDTIRRLNQKGMTVLLVEQNARAALAMADWAYILETGRLVGEGRGSDLLRDESVQLSYLGQGLTPRHAADVASAVKPPVGIRGPRD